MTYKPLQPGDVIRAGDQYRAWLDPTWRDFEDRIGEQWQPLPGTQTRRPIPDAPEAPKQEPADDNADLRAQLAHAEKERAAFAEHLAKRAQTDSLVASCDCHVKTNEVRHHGAGCRYRLISERDQAQKERDEAHAYVKMLREALEMWQHTYRETDSEYDECESTAKMADAALAQTPAEALAACTLRWQSQADDSGSWWWWNEDEDSLPILVEVALSGTDGTYFAMTGQHGWNRYQTMDEMGGAWAKATIPSQPTEWAGKHLTEGTK